MLALLAVQAIAIAAIVLAVWLYYRQTNTVQEQAKETHRIDRDQVHLLRNDLNAEQLRYVLLEKEYADYRAKYPPPVA